MCLKTWHRSKIYDAYSLIIDIIKRAKNKILIIDNYIDDSILEMLQKKNKDVEVVILTIQNNSLTKFISRITTSKLKQIIIKTIQHYNITKIKIYNKKIMKKQ